MLYEKTALPNNNVPYLTLPPPRKSGTTSYSDHSSLSDQLIWDAFKGGDEPAFIWIYKHYSKALYDHGCKYTPDKELVRDCLQDFFIYLRKNRIGFGDTTSIKLYLFKAFKRRIIEYLKKNSCRFSLKDLSESSQCQVEASIEAIYINNQIKAEQLYKLNKALRTLDRKEQEAIYYFYFKGLSYKKIAELFKFSHVSSARRVMYRSLRQLRESF